MASLQKSLKSNDEPINKMNEIFHALTDSPCTKILFYLGGFCLKKFNLDSKGAIKLYMGCQLLILPLYFGFLFNCPTPSIAGVNVPYPNETVIQRLSQCNNKCDCSQNSQQGLLLS